MTFVVYCAISEFLYFFYLQLWIVKEIRTSYREYCENSHLLRRCNVMNFHCYLDIDNGQGMWVGVRE